MQDGCPPGDADSQRKGGPCAPAAPSDPSPLLGRAGIYEAFRRLGDRLTVVTERARRPRQDNPAVRLGLKAVLGRRNLWHPVVLNEPWRTPGDHGGLSGTNYGRRRS